MPQRPPGAHEAALLAAELLALPRLEKSDKRFFTCGLLHDGQVTSEMADELRTNLSKVSPQFLQSNSKIGILLTLGQTGGDALDALPGLFGDRFERGLAGDRHHQLGIQEGHFDQPFANLINRDVTGQ